MSNYLANFEISEFPKLVEMSGNNGGDKSRPYVSENCTMH